MADNVILAIDQGTTSTRAVIFDRQCRVLGQAAEEIKSAFPQPGWVEQNAADIWQSVAHVVPRALAAASKSTDAIAAIGITNQRETVVAWDRDTSRPLAKAIVWQDRRTADFCHEHQAKGKWLSEKTGLVLDPYFSATKIHWLLNAFASLQSLADRGKLAVGTVDSWLLWNLTGGASFSTDETNASRTLLLNIHERSWDEESCRFFGVAPALLPSVKPSVSDFGKTKGLTFLPDGIPISGIAGDQQAALVGQGGFAAGDAKCTYGTGAFFLQHTGERCVQSEHRLLTSLAATTGGKAQYVVEGSVFVAGAAVQWLRDGLKLFSQAADIEELAKNSDAKQPVVFVPALVGLGAPHWVAEAQGAIFGLTRATTKADIARAALEGVALQIADLVDAAEGDTNVPLKELRVDGGMARNEWFVQRQADFLGLPVVQSAHAESTALGAALLAGMQVGMWSNTDEVKALLSGGMRFDPTISPKSRAQRLEEWRRAVQTVIGYHKP